MNLGKVYDNGRGVRQDYSEAFQWYKKAAEQGNAEAFFNLGSMYLQGQGVKNNIYMAIEYFGKACGKGHQTSCDIYRKLTQSRY